MTPHLKDGDDAGKLADKLDMPVIARTVGGDITRGVILVYEVVPSDVHTCTSTKLSALYPQ